MWDYFDNKIFGLLEDEMDMSSKLLNMAGGLQVQSLVAKPLSETPAKDASLHDKRIMDNNPILLEEKDADGQFTFVEAGTFHQR